MLNKKIVWDLFGGLNGSVGKALDNDKYEIYTIDILPKTKDGKDNIVIDLATDNLEELMHALSKLPKPDIIVASPVCTSFSQLTAMKGGNLHWLKNEDGTITKRPEEHYERLKDFSNKRFIMTYEQSKQKTDIGVNGLRNTIHIINMYEPKHWYIENPAFSLMWKYIKNNMRIDRYENIAHYGAYGFDSRKPTIFLSNIELNLKKVPKGWKANKLHTFKIKQEKDKSDIPESLIKDIFKEFDNG